MIINYCDNIFLYTLNTDVSTPITEHFSGIQVNGIVYDSPDNYLLTDTVNILNFLNSLNIGQFTYTVVGSLVTITILQSAHTFNYVYLTFNLDTPTPTGYAAPWPAPVNCIYDFDPLVVRGCMDPDAENYNLLATEDNDSCHYKPLADLDKLRCCVMKKNHEYMQQIEYGLIAKDDLKCARMNAWRLRMMMEILDKYISVGTIIREAIEASDQIAASASLSFASYNPGSFFSIQIGAGEPLIFDQNDVYYATIDDLLAAIVEYIMATVESPDDFTASVNGSTLTVTAPLSAGSAFNGSLLTLFLRQIYIYNAAVIVLDLSFAPWFGCYDPDKDEVWYGNLSSFGITYYKNRVMQGTLIPAPPGSNYGEVVYNPIMQRKYCPLAIDPSTNDTSIIYIIDNTNTLLAPKLTNIGSTQSSGLLIVGHYYTIQAYVAGDDFISVGALANVTGTAFIATGTTPAVWTNSSVIRKVGDIGMQFGKWNPVAGQMGFSVSSPPEDINLFYIYKFDETLLFRVVLPSGTMPGQVAVHPISGFYYIACAGTQQIAVIDPVTGATSFFSTFLIPITLTFVEESFGLPAGAYHLWVGSQDAITSPTSGAYEVYDASGSYIFADVLPGESPIHIIQRPSSKNVYVSYLSSPIPGNYFPSLIRHTDGVIMIPHFNTGVGTNSFGGMVIDPGSNDLYLSCNANLRRLFVIAEADDSFTREAEFAGGADQTDAVEGEYSDADDNCATEEENTDLTKKGLSLCADCCT